MNKERERGRNLKDFFVTFFFQVGMKLDTFLLICEIVLIIPKKDFYVKVKVNMKNFHGLWLKF